MIGGCTAPHSSILLGASFFESSHYTDARAAFDLSVRTATQMRLEGTDSCFDSDFSDESDARLPFSAAVCSSQRVAVDSGDFVSAHSLIKESRNSRIYSSSARYVLRRVSHAPPLRFS